MAAFLALYRGGTISEAQLVAVTADPRLVQDFAARLITDDRKPDEDHRDGPHLIVANQDNEE